VEAELGQVSPDFPHVGDQDAVNAARRSWAEGVMAVTLDLGARRSSLFGGPAGVFQTASGLNKKPAV